MPLLLTSVVGQVFSAASTAGKGDVGLFGGGAVRGRSRGRASRRQTNGRSCMKPILAKSRETLDRFTDFDPATLYEAPGRRRHGRSRDSARLAGRERSAAGPSPSSVRRATT